MELVKYKRIDRDIDIYTKLFKTIFNIETNLQFARAPGRVNIIGEHVDYCGYSVFPMAIKNDIFIVFSTAPAGNKLLLRNKENTYEPFDIDLGNQELIIDNNCPKWYNYFLCGYKGIMDYAKENGLKLPNISLYVLVSGNIPSCAGLSSSSALVVCSAMVTMKSFGLNIPKKTLAKLCASCERYIGTQGGGMDQFISIMAEAGSAMIIDFGHKEIVNESISLPKESVFVVTNSLQQMNKAASSQFNERVVESRLSAKLLLKLIQPEMDIGKFLRMSDVQSFLNLDFGTMSKKIDELIEEKYSRQRLIDLLQVSEDVFRHEILSANTLESKIYGCNYMNRRDDLVTEFQLYKRAKHIVSEAYRVMKFREICLSGDGDGDGGNLPLLGQLMNESQNSLRDLYACSSEILDSLVDICRKAGSLGSRLTGAGWGGCVISMVSIDKIDEFLIYVAENFYKKPIEQTTNEMFVTSPSDGAAFLLLE